MRNYILSFVGLFVSASLLAGIYCPPDVTIDCQSDIHNLWITGEATPGGTYHGWEPSYEDWGEIPNCGSGSIIRKWWVDLDWDGKIDYNEPYCTQNIYVQHDGGSVTIEWPDDIHIGCDDPVPNSQPWISHGPCDLIATSVEDQYFDISNGVCSKILRHFTVINWCVYETGGTEGIYHYTQKIFFQDSEAPVLGVCEDITLSTSDCKGTFTVSNSATDTGFCTSENISWIIKVDLDSDGDIDYEYNSNHNSGQFYIPPTMNGEEVTIELPIQVGIGWHNVIWKIYDGCGNVDYCSQMVTMRDNSPPTPICYTNLSTVLMPTSGMVELNVHTMIKEAYDNCSWPEWIDFSFTPEPGTETMIFDCDSEGVEMVQVYAIDIYGNYDYCKVMILFQDNSDTCPIMRAYSAEVMDATGQGINQVEMTFQDADGNFADQVMSDQTGEFIFQDTQLSQHLELTPYKVSNNEALTVLDLLVLKKHLFGELDLNQAAQYLGDLDHNGQLNFADLGELRNKLLFEDQSELVFSHWNANKEKYVFQDMWTLWEAADKDTYYGFQMGDVSADYSGQIKNDMIVDSRTKQVLDSKMEQGIYSLFLPETACLNALQLNLEIPISLVDDFKGFGTAQLDDAGLEWNLNDQILKIIWTNESCSEFNSIEPILSIVFGDDAEASPAMIGPNYMVQNDQLKESKLTLKRDSEIEKIEAQIISQNKLLSILVDDELIYDFQIVDVNGKMIKSAQNVSGNQMIRLSDAAAGLYFVQLRPINQEKQALVKTCFIH